jgi:hypothetical protein
LDLFIKLRNKVEHRHVEKYELDMLVFGECQSLLYNFETLLVDLFGSDYAISENLAYSLQFSSMRTSEQLKANKRALSADLADIKQFVENYRSMLPQDVFDSPAYSVKLIQIPKIANASRNDLAIEFVNWSALSDDDKVAFQKIGALIKDRIIKQPVVNLGGLKPGKVLDLVASTTGVRISHHDHRCLYTIFSIRPDKLSNDDPFNTNPEFCHYDEVHDDYVYSEAWVGRLCLILTAGKMKKFMWTQAFKAGRHYLMDSYLGV